MRAIAAKTLARAARTAPRARPLSALEKDTEAPRTMEPGFGIDAMARNGAPAYLDVQATSPVDPRVLDAMLPYFLGNFGNAHSKTHAFGWESEKAVENARESLAKLIGADSREVVFTSGATESNNMSVKGIARFYGAKKKHIVTTQTEHKCVLDSCRALEREGFEVTYLPVERATGMVNLDELRSAVRPGETCLVSVMVRVPRPVARRWRESCAKLAPAPSPRRSPTPRYAIAATPSPRLTNTFAGRQQRDRHAAAPQGDRRNCERSQGLLPHGRGADGREATF